MHKAFLLRQPFYFTINNGDALCLRILGKTGHPKHVTGNGNYHLTATVDDDITDTYRKNLPGNRNGWSRQRTRTVSWQYIQDSG